jgi:hypothetical protein
MLRAAFIILRISAASRCSMLSSDPRAGFIILKRLFVTNDAKKQG